MVSHLDREGCPGGELSWWGVIDNCPDFVMGVEDCTLYILKPYRAYIFQVYI